ncbi:hypothetical protein SAMN05518865_109270 [Duganella sp. CF458]|uniref:hypothetical protein n=1 Tax=Duganella sp. CF458 TaxID=1884368 RepID=UPI0008F2A405|nr:hypothetical protein [Duganella sp. CF458]SFG22713.1 hypothetical protein SAMN05518865_109270 [Duganella sp. CF458]
MTYLLHIVAREVPANDAEVLPFLEQIAGATISIAPSQQLKSFRDAIVKLFPCLSSYGAGDKAIETCPWADGPLADNFKGGYGSVAISRRHDEVIPHVLRIASDLGVTVVDEQNGAVHRPQAYQVVLEGPLEGVEVEVAATQLAELMNQPLPQMVLLLHSRRRTLVKKGLTRSQAEVYVSALRDRASCRASVSAEPRKSPGKNAPVAPAKALPKAPVQAPSAPPLRVAPAQPVTTFDQPEVIGIQPDERMFKAADAQRMAAAATVVGIALLLLVMVLRVKSPYLTSIALAMHLLGAIAVVRFGQAMGSGLLRTLVFAVLALVPGLGTLLVVWTYFRAAGVLKANGLTSRNAPLDADEVRELAGLDGMLPSTKCLLVLLVLGAAGGFALSEGLLLM